MAGKQDIFEFELIWLHHVLLNLELKTVVAHLETIPWNHKNVISAYDYA